MAEKKENSAKKVVKENNKIWDKSTNPFGIYLEGEELEMHFIKAKTRLNQKQIDFCMRYVETLDKVESYRYAYGESVKDASAYSGAITLLSKQHIKDFIDVLIYHGMQEMEMKFSLVSRIYKEIEKMAMAPDYKYPSQKLEALKMIARAQGMFAEDGVTDIEALNRASKAELEKRIKASIELAKSGTESQEDKDNK